MGSLSHQVRGLVQKYSRITPLNTMFRNELTSADLWVRPISLNWNIAVRVLLRASILQRHVRLFGMTKVKTNTNFQHDSER